MPVRSSGRALRATLPKRSTSSTLADSTPSRASDGGTSMRTRSAGSSSGADLARASRPAARWAATGANTSRPWNVAETGCRNSSSAVMIRARSMPPSASAAGTSSPLSGPTRSAPSTVSSTSARRCEPTPGSTTPRCTPSGRYGTADASVSEPATTFVGSMPCVTWMTRTSGRRADDDALDDAGELVAQPEVGDQRDDRGDGHGRHDAAPRPRHAQRTAPGGGPPGAVARPSPRRRS